MTGVFGWAVASIRRGPAQSRGAACVALGISLFGICWVATELARVLLR